MKNLDTLLTESPIEVGPLIDPIIIEYREDYNAYIQEIAHQIDVQTIEPTKPFSTLKDRHEALEEIIGHSTTINNSIISTIKRRSNKISEIQDNLKKLNALLEERIFKNLSEPKKNISDVTKINSLIMTSMKQYMNLSTKTERLDRDTRPLREDLYALVQDSKDLQRKMVFIAELPHKQGCEGLPIQEYNTEAQALFNSDKRYNRVLKDLRAKNRLLETANQISKKDTRIRGEHTVLALDKKSYAKLRQIVSKTKDLAPYIGREQAKKHMTSKSAKQKYSLLKGIINICELAELDTSNIQHLLSKSKVVLPNIHCRDEYKTALQDLLMSYSLFPSGMLPKNNIAIYKSPESLVKVMSSEKYSVDLHGVQKIFKPNARKYIEASFNDSPFKVGERVPQTVNSGPNPYYQACLEENNWEKAYFKIVKKGHHTRIPVAISKTGDTAYSVKVLTAFDSHQAYDAWAQKHSNMKIG